MTEPIFIIKIALKECTLVLNRQLRIQSVNAFPKKLSNDKSNLTVYDKWVTAKTKAAYRKINTTVNPYNINYQKLQNNLVENMGRDFLHNKVLTFNSLDTERDK